MGKLAALFLFLFSWPAVALTVVFIPGLGDGKESFAALAKKLPDGVSVHNEVMPDSLPGDEDGRSPHHAARELHARLIGEGHSAPFILVAHSVGGPEAVAFALSFPDETAGLVLVDPRLPGFSRRCKAAGLSGCSLPSLLRAAMPPGQIALLDAIERLPDAEDWVKGMPGVPVVLFSAGRPPFGAGKAWARLWQQVHADFIAALPNGKLVPVPSSRHYIHKEKPKLVLQEILSLVR